MKNIIHLETNNSDDYDKKYIKTKFNLDDDLPLKKALELPDILVVIRYAFNDGNGNVFLNGCLCKLAK